MMNNNSNNNDTRGIVLTVSCLPDIVEQFMMNNNSNNNDTSG